MKGCTLLNSSETHTVWKWILKYALYLFLTLAQAMLFMSKLASLYTAKSL